MLFFILLFLFRRVSEIYVQYVAVLTLSVFTIRVLCLCCIVHCVCIRRQTAENQDQSDFYRTNKSTLLHKSLCKWSADPAKSTPYKCTHIDTHTSCSASVFCANMRDFYSTVYGATFIPLYFSGTTFVEHGNNNNNNATIANDDVAKFADVIVSYCPYKLHYSAVAQAALMPIPCIAENYVHWSTVWCTASAVFLARVNYVYFASVDAFVVVVLCSSTLSSCFTKIEHDIGGWCLVFCSGFVWGIWSA